MNHINDHGQSNEFGHIKGDHIDAGHDDGHDNGCHDNDGHDQDDGSSYGHARLAGQRTETEPRPDHPRPGDPTALPPLPDGVPRMEGDVFQVPVGPAGGFEAIVAALTRKLSTTAVPTHVGMVALYPYERPGRFTQCLVDVEMGAWAECVSNEYLTDDDRLSEADQQLLLDAGFGPPDDLHPNHWLIQEAPVDWPMIAHLLVAPFGTVWPVRPNEVMELVVNPTFQDNSAYEYEEEYEEDDDDGQDDVEGPDSEGPDSEGPHGDTSARDGRLREPSDEGPVA